MTFRKSVLGLFVALFAVLILNILPLGIGLNVFSATDHIVISEVQIAGLGDVDEDFIELYNPTDVDYDLNGHRLVKRTASGTSDNPIKSFISETIIPAHGYYLWASSTWQPSVLADASTSATLAADNGIALRYGSADTGNIIDSVGWGLAKNIFVENSAYPINPGAGESIERKPGENDAYAGNEVDTNDNSSDFLLRLVSEPQNSKSQTEPVSVPTPTEGLLPAPTDEPLPTPTEEPVPTPTDEIIPTPTVTSIPTIAPTPTPSPNKKHIIGVFGFGEKMRVCTLSYEHSGFGFFRVFFPRISCFYPYK